jgi:hypothetical protein
MKSASKTKPLIKGGEKMDMWIVLYRTGPICVGIFLVCLGGMICLLAKADEISKRAKAFAREKGLEKR